MEADRLLCRGFNLKRNEWIIGFFLVNRGACFVAPDEFADGRSWDDYEVVPESVGRNTGFRDESGNYIYEGDKVELEGMLRVVVWHDGYFGLATREQYADLQKGCHPFLNDYAHLDLLYEAVMSVPIKVVGNMYM